MNYKYDPSWHPPYANTRNYVWLSAAVDCCLPLSSLSRNTFFSFVWRFCFSSSSCSTRLWNRCTVFVVSFCFTRVLKIQTKTHNIFIATCQNTHKINKTRSTQKKMKWEKRIQEKLFAEIVRNVRIHFRKCFFTLCASHSCLRCVVRVVHTLREREFETLLFALVNENEN